MSEVQELGEGQQGWLGQQEESKGHNILPNTSHPYELHGADEV